MSEEGKPEKVALTTRESELVVIAMQCLAGGVKVQLDWEKFTQMADYKNANSARTNFQAVIKKLSEGTVDKIYVAQSSVANPAAPKKRAAKPKAAAKETATNDGEMADNDATPEKPKRKRAPPKPKTPVAEQTSDNEKTPPTMAPKKKRATKASSEAPEPKRAKKSPEAKEEVKPEIKPEVKSEDTVSEPEPETENFFDAALEPSSSA
ncbi:MAG: hypothetical protein Q9207_005090 [Kuettlingeria erythrocarpa]